MRRGRLQYKQLPTDREKFIYLADARGQGEGLFGLCVLFSYALVLSGMRYLKEPFGWPQLLACGPVLVGVLVMKC